MLTGLDELSPSQHSGVEHWERPPGLHRGLLQHPADVPHLLQLWYVSMATYKLYCVVEFGEIAKYYNGDFGA